MNNQAYFKASTMQTMLQLSERRYVRIDFSKMENANVAALIEKDDGIITTRLYILASVKPPNRNVQVYLSDRDEIVTTDVVQLFNVCQNSACWVELN